MKNLKSLFGAAALLLTTLGTSLSANAVLITQEGRINGENIFNLAIDLDEDVLDSAIASDPLFDPTMADNLFYPELLTLQSVKFFGESVDLANVFQFDAVFNALDLTQGFSALTLDIFSESLNAGLLFEYDRAFPEFNFATIDIDGELLPVDGSVADFSVVPEPAAYGIFALAMGLLMVRRQRS